MADPQPVARINAPPANHLPPTRSAATPGRACARLPADDRDRSIASANRRADSRSRNSVRPSPRPRFARPNADRISNSKDPGGTGRSRPARGSLPRVPDTRTGRGEIAAIVLRRRQVPARPPAVRADARDGATIVRITSGSVSAAAHMKLQRLFRDGVKLSAPQYIVCPSRCTNFSFQRAVRRRAS